MKALIPGHTYELANVDKPDEQGEIIQFIHKEPVSEGSTELKLVSDGTTNEEVLGVLIDRMKFLQDAFPCRENAVVIARLTQALAQLHRRTADRLARKVEGENKA